MFKNVLQFTVIFSIAIIVYAFSSKESNYSKYVSGDNNGLPNTVEEALLLIGDAKPIHYISQIDADSVRMGEEMVKFGKLLDGSNKRLSKYFVCTDCHNLQMESADPSDESPEAVLEYGIKNDIPFLPASTFYGMYNKRHWYNGDYSKKYGDLVKPTRDSLYNAIQLCAVQCSQGRELEFWEVRSILHYYKSLAYKISDLSFNQSDLKKFGQLLVTDKQKALKMLKSKYNDINPATFGESEIPKIDGYQPNADNGKYIYTKGCMHCHDANTGITDFKLLDDVVTARFLYRKKDKYNHFAVPHISRHGTYAFSGRKQYMPLYSYEKMSKKQMLDLLHYIEVKAGK